MVRGSRAQSLNVNEDDTQSNILQDVASSMKKCGGNLSNVLAAGQYRAFRALQDDEPGIVGVSVDSELIDVSICTPAHQVCDSLLEDSALNGNESFYTAETSNAAGTNPFGNVITVGLNNSNDVFSFGILNNPIGAWTEGTKNITVVAGLSNVTTGVSNIDTESPNVNSPKGINNSGYNDISNTSPEAIKSLLENFSADMVKVKNAKVNTSPNPGSNLDANGLNTNSGIFYGPSHDTPINTFLNGTTSKTVLLNDVAIPSNDTPIVRLVSIPKPIYVDSNKGSSVGCSMSGPYSNKGLEDVLVSGPWMIHNSPIILKKWTMNTNLFKEELTRILVWVKLHDVQLQVFSKDGISLIATQISKAIMLDSFTSSMCIDSWDRSIFARCLIEVKDDEEMVRVEYEWKPPCCEQCKIFGHVYDQCPKNATAIPTVDMNNDGFQTVVNKRKSGKTGSTNTSRSGVIVGKATWQPIKPKVRFEPKAHGNSPKNVTPNVSTSAKDGPNIVSKKQLAKAVDIPSSSYTSVTAKKGGRQCTENMHIPVMEELALRMTSLDRSKCIFM
ncbi:zinc knuckle CX2CX4HX4C containing protein [Tanacetum coccineum]